jgi:hypothetical protein
MSRVLILIVALAASAANAQAVGHDSRSHKSASQTHANPQAKPNPGDLSAIKDQIHSIASALESANNKRQTKEEKDSAARNLVAQETLAFWAGCMFWVGLGEIVVTIVGVIFIWLTLNVSWATAKEAKRAADEARRQADVAEAGLRPHLFVDNVRVREPVNANWLSLSEGEFASKRPDVFYDIKNYGRSPAIIRELKGGIYIGPELPVMPTPNGNDIWTDEMVISTDNKERGREFFFFYRKPFTKTLLHDLVLTRADFEADPPTRFFFFVQIRYEGPNQSVDEFGVLWEYLVDIGRWLPRPEIANYTYRRQGSVAAVTIATS